MKTQTKNVEKSFESMNLIAPKDQAGLRDLIRTRIDRLEELEREHKKLTRGETATAAQKIAINQYLTRIANLENLNSTKTPYKAYLAGQNRNILKPRIEFDWGSNLSDDQMQKLITAEIERQIAYQLIHYYELELTTIEETYEFLLKAHSKGTKSRLRGREINAEKNKAILRDCLQKLKNLKKGKKLQSIDYVEFREIALGDGSKPAFIPTARIVGEKRGLPLNERLKYIESMKRTNWSESTLRKFFKEETKLDPTTKKGKS
jgi:hypothetical protein